MNKNNTDEKLNNQIRIFLKQVGVNTHQILVDHANNLNSDIEANLKLFINKKEVKEFTTILNKP